MVVRLIGSVQPGNPGGATRLVFYLRSFGASAALFDPTDDSLRGAGLAQPQYVVAEGPEAAASAAKLFSQDRPQCPNGRLSVVPVTGELRSHGAVAP